MKNEDLEGVEKADMERKTAWDNAVRENKSWRVTLDTTLQQIKNSPRKSRSRSLAITHLEDVIMRLGMDLKELREENPEASAALNPYPSSYDPSNTTIEPTADNLKM